RLRADNWSKLARLPPPSSTSQVWPGCEILFSCRLRLCVSHVWSVYYFGRSVGSDRIVAFSTSILAWSTNAYWNLTIWGGAYDRAFTIPLLFIAVGATYRYASQVNYGGRSTREYWLCLAAWTLVYLGDVFVAIAGTLLTVIF